MTDRIIDGEVERLRRIEAAAKQYIAHRWLMVDSPRQPPDPEWEAERNRLVFELAVAVGRIKSPPPTNDLDPKQV